MFTKVELQKNWTEAEKEVLALWKSKEIFAQSIEQTKDNERFVFFEGPPTANGKPGIHHILARAYKDLICRYKSMQGFYVPRKAGWDTHGLPVELEVEKSLKIDSKSQIEEFGIDKFIEKCKESIFTYKKNWEGNATERIGYWVDMENPYITYQNEYIESIWWALQEIFNKGLLFEGYKAVPHCPRCQTTLSSHEVAQGYKEVNDPSIFIRFPMKKDQKVALLIWTTTPWTLTANVAVAVKEKAIYCKVKTEDGIFIVAKDRVPAIFDEYEIIEEIQGSELVGIEYDAPYHFYDSTMNENGHKIVTANYVSMEDGTGLVHIAPAFGVDDMEIGKEKNLPMILSVNYDGTLKDEVTPWKGMWIKDADKKIIADLKERKIMFRSLSAKHTYPFCWRCKSPLMYVAKTSWFIRVSSLRKELQENNETINWLPSHIKKGRFGEWIKEAKDWAISRERYWGTPLNIWSCEECDHKVSIGSIKELKQRANIPEEEVVELHRPYIDNVTITCPKCGRAMHRVKDVLDCWLDSGSMPFAQHHYPFEHKDDFNDLFPADFISEGIDQTRGWFYTMLVLSTILFKKAPYKNVLTFELVLDDKGEKMSKSRGNVVDVEEVLDTFGADAIRWAMYTSSTPYVPRRFSKDQLKDSLKNFIIPLLNVLSFFVTYANIDQWKPNTEELNPEDIQSDIDRWILSKLSSLSDGIVNKLDTFNVTDPARSISVFVDELTNWYIRRSRRRFWRSENDNDKKSAYQTLHYVLFGLSKLIAPFTPFLAEYIYQILKSGSENSWKDSVHLYSYPKHEQHWINLKLENTMDVTKGLVNAGLRARKISKVKVRTPFSVAYVYVPSDLVLDEDNVMLIKEELNVKSIEIVNSFEKFAEYSVKPNLPILGKKYGRKIPLIKKALQSVSTSDLRKVVSGGEKLILSLSDESEITLSSEDVIISVLGKDRFIAGESIQQSIIIIDPMLTNELLQEGYAREMVHHIQLYRKQIDLDVEQHIHLLIVEDNEEVNGLIKEFKDYICKETLSDDINFVDRGSLDSFNTKEPYVFDLSKKIGSIELRIR
ncbi:MAG: isoleucine--tRNA ligase [Caldisericia bacterium]|nr:isoleucine--tRNA ligase [Caldisericia bacterium]